MLYPSLLLARACCDVHDKLLVCMPGWLSSCPQVAALKDAAAAADEARRAAERQAAKMEVQLEDAQAEASELRDQLKEVTIWGEV